MLLNKLYRFINEPFNALSNNQSLDKDRFHFKPVQKQQNYIIYELPVDHRITVAESKTQQYVVRSHHISFYKTQDDRNPCLSQYHYTAYLQDNSKKVYQLHVYFDHHDQLTTDPLFSIEDENGSYVTQNVKAEFSHALDQLAMDKSNNFIAELRRQYQNFLNKLETRYNELEQELRNLSSDLMANRDAYLALLKDAMVILNQLSDYHSNTQYGAILTLFTRIEKALLIAPETPRVTGNDDNVVEKTVEVGVEVNNNASPPTTAPEITKKSIKTLIQQALVSQAAFLALPSSAYYEEQLKFFHSLLEDAQTALIATEDDHYDVTPNDLQIIQTLLSKSTTEAKRLLTHLLLNDRFDLTESLKPFVSAIANHFIGFSLCRGNATLLDFLLSNSDFPINTSYVTENLSPVLFCFLKHTPKTPKTACLSVLIKHNASLMVKTEDGLSVAYHILNTCQHPLREALAENPKKTLANQRFFKAVISEIENYISQSNPDKIKRDKLLFVLETFKILSISLVDNHLANKKQLEITSQHLEKTESFLKKAASEAIKADKDTQQKSRDLQKLYKDYQSTLSKREITQLKRQNNQVIENVNDMLELSNIRSMDIADLKAQILEALDVYASILNLKIALIDIQKTLKETSSAKVNVRKIRSLETRQREIVNEIKTLCNQYTILTNSEILADLRVFKKDLDAEVSSFFAPLRPTSECEERSFIDRLTKDVSQLLLSSMLENVFPNNNNQDPGNITKPSI